MEKIMTMEEALKLMDEMLETDPELKQEFDNKLEEAV